VAIETRVGESTSVKVYLPRADAARNDPEREPADPQQGPGLKVTSRILVVDDDEAVLRSTVRTLEFLGYPALPAETGGEALSLIASRLDIGLVLADLAMPGMDGVELARAIGARRPGLPVIIVTGHGDLENLKEFGQSRILQKPYSEHDLEAIIAAALK
jgi:CheY-like chemotaxis protein